jgi:hypothetical protein
MAKELVVFAGGQVFTKSTYLPKRFSAHHLELARRITRVKYII